MYFRRIVNNLYSEKVIGIYKQIKAILFKNSCIESQIFIKYITITSFRNNSIFFSKNNINTFQVGLQYMLI